jgi:diacylglycerol kinase family enzyme
VAIVDNPQASGGRYAQHGAWAQQVYRLLGYECARLETRAPGDAARLAREAAGGGATLVIACGGDGAVRETVTGLMEVPAAVRPRFSVIPKGTVNVFARTMGLQVGPVPDFFHACLKQIFWARTTRVDVARIDGSPFVCFAGFGYDAAVIENVPAGEKRLFREWAFVTAAFRTLFGWGAPQKLETPWQPTGLRVQGTLVGGARIDLEGYLVAAGNVKDYGPGWFPFHPKARLDDGLLDVVVVTTHDKLEMLRIGAQVVHRSHLKNRNVEYFQTPGPVRIESLGEPVPTHADCELVGRSRASELTLEPAALTVVH